MATELGAESCTVHLAQCGGDELGRQWCDKTCTGSVQLLCRAEHFASLRRRLFMWNGFGISVWHFWDCRV